MEEFILVEYPAIVNNVERAGRSLNIDLTGGRAEISPEEEWRPSIRGELKDTCALVVRLPQRPSTGNDEGRHLEEAKIVGKVTKLARFRSILDFATTPPAASEAESALIESTENVDFSKLEELAKRLSDRQWREGKEGQQLGTAGMGPPRLSPSEFPFFRSVESNGGGLGGGGGLESTSAAIVSSRKKGKQAPWMRLFSDANVMASELAPRELVLRCKRLHRHHFETLTRLFQERPVWLKFALQPYVTDIGPTEIKTYSEREPAVRN